MKAKNTPIANSVNVKATKLKLKDKITLPKKGNAATKKRSEHDKENKTKNTITFKNRLNAKIAGTRKTTKFALINIINSTRGVYIKERSLEERLKYFKYFNDKDNILLLFKNKYKTRFEDRYLEFRSYDHPIDMQFPNIEDKGVYFKMLCGGAKIVEQIFKDNELYPTKVNSKPVVFWSNSVISNDFYSSLDCYQKINHFPKSCEISRKDFMFLNIVKMRQKFPKDFDFIPNAFILPKDHGMLVKEIDLNHSKKTYICKPVASSQGRGIFLTNDINEVF